MTDLNNSNAEDERPTPAPDDGAHDAQNPHGAKPDDELWAEFESGHADDLGDIAHSRSAKRFERRAARKEKEALLSVGDLDEGAFTDDMPRPTRGPRDFTASSWLDTDAVLDAQGSDFVPPNPVIGHIDATMIVFWTMLVVGIAGVIASVLLPPVHHAAGHCVRRVHADRRRGTAHAAPRACERPRRHLRRRRPRLTLSGFTQTLGDPLVVWCGR